MVASCLFKADLFRINKSRSRDLADMTTDDGKYTKPLAIKALSPPFFAFLNVCRMPTERCAALMASGRYY